MPYVNMSGSRRRVSARVARRYTKRKRLAPKTRAAVKKVVKKSMMALAEKKYGDTVTSTAVDLDSTNGLIVALTQFAQGDTDNNNRNGDQILPTSMSYQAAFRFNQQATVGTGVNVLRFIIFRWKPFYGDIAPSLGAVLQYTASKQSPDSPIVHDNRNQLNVLVDRTFTTDGVHNPIVVLKGSLPLKKKVQYKAGSTTNMAGGLFCLMTSDAVALSAIYPSLLHYCFRVNYNDS